MATAPHGHQLDRALNAKTTLLCVLAGCLFPGEGYDGILRITFGMPGLDLKPGTPVPTSPALSKARALPGEQVARRAFELDAARADVETTARRPSCSAMTLAGEFGVPAGGTKPRACIVAHVRAGSRRWIGGPFPSWPAVLRRIVRPGVFGHALGGERGGDRLPAAGAD